MQMAVLATYSDAECVALYHYCRSILSSQPFAGGFENLALLFASNAEAYRKLPSLAPSAAQAGVGGGKPRNSRKPVPLKPFLTRFVYLHGLLFSWTTIMHQSYAQLQDSQESAFSSSAPSFGQQEPLSGSQASSWVPVLKTGLSAPAGGVGGGNNGDNDFDRKYEHFTALLRQVLNEYEVHLTAGNLPDALLVRLLAICLFSVHYAVGKEANLLSYIALAGAKDGGGGSAVQQWLEEQRRHCADPQSQARTGTECLALLMLFGIISRWVITMITTFHSHMCFLHIFSLFRWLQNGDSDQRDDCRE